METTGMDVRRPGAANSRRRRRILIRTAVIGVLALVLLGLWRLEPAAPRIDRSTVWIDTVQRGEMVRNVRGAGTLVPEEIRHLAARSDGTVERIAVRPGSEVEPETVILVLGNPALEQASMDATLALAAAEAEYRDLEVRLESELLDEQATAARVASEFRQAELRAAADRELLEAKLIAELQYQLSQVRADELEGRTEIERRRVEIAAKSGEARLESARARLEQTRALAKLRQEQLAGLEVRANIEGVLQEVPVEIGENVTSGSTLAVVARPDTLKAEVRVPESQAGEIGLGQSASIDTRQGLVEGRVTRIDPGVRAGTVTVDVALLGDLPRGARPDLSVDATIEVERLSDVLYVGRPAHGEAGSSVTLFRLADDDRTALRVPVELGRTSVHTIEIVRGLSAGEQVVLNDITRFEEYDRIRLD